MLRPRSTFADPNLPPKKRPRLSLDNDHTSNASTFRGPVALSQRSVSASQQLTAEAKVRRLQAIMSGIPMTGSQASTPVKAPEARSDGDVVMSQPQGEIPNPTADVVPSSQEDGIESEHVSKVDAAGKIPITVEIDMNIADDDEDTAPIQAPDFSDWFKPSSEPAIFVPASQLSTVASVVSSKPAEFQPSQQALELASQYFERWGKEVDSTEDEHIKNGRQVLRDLDNEAGPSLAGSPAPKKLPRPNDFRPPLRQALPENQLTPKPSARMATQTRPPVPLFQSASLSSTSRPPSQVPPSTPIRSSLGPGARPRGLSSAVKPSFKTPFKPGMSPLTLQLRQSQAARQKAEVEAAERAKKAAELEEKERWGSVFDLRHTGVRCSMEAAGVKPGSWRPIELSKAGIPPELPSVNLDNAAYYRFNVPSSSQLLSGRRIDAQGVDTALVFLRDKGCTLATTEWVRNHWCMILWKLACLVCSAPSLFEEKWCYEEVTRQLLYRYEREINRVQRPPIRLITEGDTSAARPMVLCISTIIPGGNSQDENGVVVEDLPTLDVTDGWYRIRATIDEALGRAIKKRVLKIGSKLAVSGAKLNAGKEGMEPLEAYGKVSLELHGNSTSLARWDAKLGFRSTPFVATLRSLTPDGGPVMLMDIVITKLFPMGYLEVKDGGERPVPVNETEEREAEEEWKRRRANEEIKLRDTLQRRLYRLEGLASNLERVASGFMPKEDDYAPSEVEDVMDDLEDSEDPAALVKGLSGKNAGWLAYLIRRKCASSNEQAGELIQRELDDICPPRKVRNFRVIRFRDARTQKRPARRTGQMTVWDVKDLGDLIQEGKRLVVTNVVPCQPNSWSYHDTEAEAYFNAGQRSKWFSVPQ